MLEDSSMWKVMHCAKRIVIVTDRNGPFLSPESEFHVILEVHGRPTSHTYKFESNARTFQKVVESLKHMCDVTGASLDLHVTHAS